jgi:hypothetical protein
MRHAEEPVSSFFIMTVLTLSISLFPSLLTQVRANAYVLVWCKASVRARNPRAISALGLPERAMRQAE